jgi:hypothetical protein
MIVTARINAEMRAALGRLPQFYFAARIVNEPSAAAVHAAEAILDRAARRLLLQKIDGDAILALSGSDDHTLDEHSDEISLLNER